MKHPLWKPFLMAAAMLIYIYQVHAQYLGVTCGYDYHNNLTGPYEVSSNTPMYNPVSTAPNSTWNEWAAELKQSGVDFVCPNLTGSQPVTSKNPTNIAPFLVALNAQGNVTKVAIFDDNATSWTAQWNDANGRGFGYAEPFDLSNTNNWRYIYDYNYKLFYQTVPDANRFKISGRPLIMIWSGATKFVTNALGNYSRAMNYVRSRCQTDFGFNPYIIVSADSAKYDPTLTNTTGVVDGLQNWFALPATSFTLVSYNGTKTGVAVAQFHDPSYGSGQYLDANHGQLLKTGLAGTVGAGALVTLCEGFADWDEDAALLRGWNIGTNGSALSYNQTYYDYPNQRLDTLRQYSRTPFLGNQLFEAEGCDTFGGANGGNGATNYFRNGNIAIASTTDTNGGWQVGWINPGEWLEWTNVPLNAHPHFLVRVANPNASEKAHFVIDGVAQTAQTLPNTGSWSTWTTYDFGAYGTYTNSYHTVRIVFDTGNVNFNWWQL